jgi:shikimate dehydrogenase
MDFFLKGEEPVRLCVIGDPVAHSLSPTIHSAMLRTLGRAGQYSAQTVPVDKLGDFVQQVRAGAFHGFNATMPHKQALLDLVDELDDSARLCGAVNTVRVREGRLVGYSTDGDGLVAALEEEGARIRDAHVVLLGAGGASRSVAAALVRAGARRVSVCNRTAERSKALCAMAPEVLRPEGFDRDSLHRLCGDAALLLNATSLGMEGCPPFHDLSFLAALPAEATVCDLIYHPAETELLRLARQRGLRAVNGLPMLVWQAVLALEHFLGTPLDRSRLARAALDALAD